jgi:hypothetical protein
MPHKELQLGKYRLEIISEAIRIIRFYYFYFFLVRTVRMGTHIAKNVV